MISVELNNLSLKFQRLTPTGCKDIGIRIFKFVANTQILLKSIKEIESLPQVQIF